MLAVNGSHVWARTPHAHKNKHGHIQQIIAQTTAINGEHDVLKKMKKNNSIDPCQRLTACLKADLIATSDTFAHSNERFSCINLILSIFFFSIFFSHFLAFLWNLKKRSAKTFINEIHALVFHMQNSQELRGYCNTVEWMQTNECDSTVSLNKPSESTPLH